jgi:hypothetical protein
MLLTIASGGIRISIRNKVPIMVCDLCTSPLQHILGKIDHICFRFEKTLENHSTSTKGNYI